MLRDLVIEGATGRIGVLCVPIDLAHARVACLLVDALDQRAPDPAAAQRRQREQVLEIANRLHLVAASMEEVMSKADHFAVNFRHKGEYGLDGIEESLPGCGRDLCG